VRSIIFGVVLTFFTASALAEMPIAIVINNLTSLDSRAEVTVECTSEACVIRIVCISEVCKVTIEDDPTDPSPPTAPRTPQGRVSADDPAGTP